MELIDGWTILSGALIILFVAFACCAVVYLAINTVAHAIITTRKAKRHPMGYYTGSAIRHQVGRLDTTPSRFAARKTVKTTK